MRNIILILLALSFSQISSADTFSPQDIQLIRTVVAKGLAVREEAHGMLMWLGVFPSSTEQYLSYRADAIKRALVKVGVEGVDQLDEKTLLKIGTDIKDGNKISALSMLKKGKAFGVVAISLAAIGQANAATGHTESTVPSFSTVDLNANTAGKSSGSFGSFGEKTDAEAGTK